MSSIKIQTLTPIHVGSGIEYQKDFEFLFFPKEQKVAFIDAEKVLNVIGEENLAQWVECIDNGKPLMGLLEQRNKSLSCDDVAKRSVLANQVPTKPSIREQIHTGLGRPMLPGSSIKGSIRTVVFSEKLLDDSGLAKASGNLKDRYGKKFSDSFLNGQLMGRDPNSDIFRLLQVGDAMFESTEIFQTDVINKYHKEWKIKGEITQFVEAIPAGETASMELRYNEALQKRAGNLFNRNSTLLNVDDLFSLVNEHTSRLLKDELNYWKGEGEPLLEEYLDNLDVLLANVEGCSKNECVLRLGWGTGFRNMTGDWHGVMGDNDYYDMVKQVRPKHPDNLIFPKTTRFVKGGTPLGYLKMSF